MSAHVRIAAAVLILVGVLVGCSRTTTGTVAMTTEPGASKTSRTPTSTSRPSTPRSSPTTSPRTPNPNAPADSLTMTCEQYNDLDAATQQAVIDEIVNQEGSVFGGQGGDIAKTLADAMCQLLPTTTVSDILLGGGIPG
jgi:hypothetical protein